MTGAERGRLAFYQACRAGDGPARERGTDGRTSDGLCRLRWISRVIACRDVAKTTPTERRATPVPMESQRSRLVVDVTVVSWWEWKTKNITYTSVTRCAGKGRDARASGICTLPRVDRELDQRHLSTSSFTAGSFKCAFHGSGWTAFVRLLSEKN